MTKHPDDYDLDRLHPTSVWQAAKRIRDWIHTTPLSECNVTVDECPDWDLAFKVAKIALGEEDV